MLHEVGSYSTSENRTVSVALLLLYLVSTLLFIGCTLMYSKQWPALSFNVHGRVWTVVWVFWALRPKNNNKTTRTRQLLFPAPAIVTSSMYVPKQANLNALQQ